MSFRSTFTVLLLATPLAVQADPSAIFTPVTDPLERVLDKMDCVVQVSLPADESCGYVTCLDHNPPFGDWTLRFRDPSRLDDVTLCSTRYTKMTYRVEGTTVRIQAQLGAVPEEGEKPKTMAVEESIPFVTVYGRGADRLLLSKIPGQRKVQGSCGFFPQRKGVHAWFCKPRSKSPPEEAPIDVQALLPLVNAGASPAYFARVGNLVADAFADHVRKKRENVAALAGRTQNTSTQHIELFYKSREDEPLVHHIASHLQRSLPGELIKRRYHKKASEPLVISVGASRRGPS